MRMTLKRLTAWMLTLMMVIGCVPAYAADGIVVDYSDSTSAYDVMPLDDSASESVTVTFVINNENYVNDPNSGNSHLRVLKTTADAFEGGNLTYIDWTGTNYYKITSTGTVCTVSIPSGSSLIAESLTMPALDVYNCNDVATPQDGYRYTSMRGWVTEDGTVCNASTVFTEDTTLYLQLDDGNAFYTIDFVCGEDNHSIAASGPFQLGQTLAENYMTEATVAANKFTSDYCTHGPASNEVLSAWQLHNYTTGSRVDLSADLVITSDYATTQYGSAIKAYAVWESGVEISFKYVTPYNTFDLGTLVVKPGAKFGDILGIPDASQYNRYDTFIGWQYTDSEGNLRYATEDTVISAGMEFNAIFGTPVYARFQYTYFDETTQGSVTEIVEERARLSGDALGTLPTLTDYGIDSVVWQYTDSNNVVQIATADTVITADTYFTAVTETPQVTARFQYISSYDEETGEPVYETIAVRTLNAGDALGELPDMTAYNTLFGTFAGWQYGTDAEGNPLYATADMLITENMVFTAVFAEVECGKIIFYDVLPDGSLKDAALNISMPVGMTLTQVLEYCEDSFEDETLLSECIWRTAVNGELADMNAVVVAGSVIHLYTHTYKIVLTLNLNDAAPAAFTAKARASVDTDTTEDGTITMTITAREGETLTADQLVVDGVDLTQYAWTADGQTINLQKLITEGVTESITVTSDGTPAASDLTLTLTLTLDGVTKDYTITKAEGEAITADDCVIDGIDLTVFTWTNENGQTVTPVGTTLTSDLTLTSDGTLASTLTTDTDQQVNFYVFIDDEPVKIASKTVTAYVSGVRRYLSAATLASVYGKFGFDASDMTTGTYYFPHVDVGGTSLWGDTPVLENNKFYFSPITNNGNPADVYYIPTQSITRGGVSYITHIDTNTFYTVTVRDVNGLVYTPDTLPDTTYTLVGNTATITLDCPENVAWQCTGKDASLTDNITYVNNGDGTVTFTIANIAEPYEIQASKGNVLVAYDLGTLPETPEDTEYGTPKINGQDTYSVGITTEEAAAYVPLAPNPASYFFNSPNGKWLGEVTFVGWAVNGDTTNLVQPGTALDLSDYDGLTVTLTAQWESKLSDNANVWYSPMINFFVSIVAVSEGTTEWVGNTETVNFTDSVYTSSNGGITGSVAVDQKLYEDPPHELTHSMQYHVLGGTSGTNLSNNHNDIVSKLTAGYTMTGLDGNAYTYSATFPSDETVLKNVRKMVENGKTITINGRNIQPEELTTSNFTIKWYVFKFDNSDGWHIDGILVAKSSEMIVTKTFGGDDAAIAAVADEFEIVVAGASGNQLGIIHDGATLKLDSEGVVKNGNTYTWKVPVDQYYRYTVTENNYEYDEDLATYKAQYRVRHSTTAGENKSWSNYDGSTSIVVTGRGYNETDSDRLQVDFLNTYTKAGTVIIQKIDAVTGNLMPNVSFTIGGTRGSGGALQMFDLGGSHYTADPKEGNTETSTITTDASGQAYLWIGGGEYWLEEAVPTGYDDPGRISMTLQGEAANSYKVIAINNATAANDTTDKSFVSVGGSNNLTLIVKNYSRTIDLKVTKDWLNEENKPVTIQLYRNGNPLGAAYTVTLDGSQNWTHIFEDLPLYADGGLAQYTIREEAIGEFKYSEQFASGYQYYDVDYSAMQYLDKSGAVTTDMSEVETIALKVSNDRNHGSLTISKVDGKAKPVSGAVFYLYKVPENSTTVPTVSEIGNTGTYEISGMTPYKTVTSAENGTVNFGEVEAGRYYVVEHSAPMGYAGSTLLYSVLFDGSNATMQYYDTVGGWTTTASRVVNTSVTVDIPVLKVWADAANPGKRPTYIEVTLTGTAGGAVVSTNTVRITADDGDVNMSEGGEAIPEGTWYYTFEDLPQYSGSNPIIYTLTEAAIPGYVTTIIDPNSKDEVPEFKITNTLRDNLKFTVSKQVKGNFADPNKEFLFTAEIKGSTGETISTETFELSHGESHPITNIPYGATVTVTENPDGYTAQYMLGTEKKDGATYTSAAITDDQQGVTFVNTKNVTIETGVDLDGLPYAMLLLGAAGLGLIWLMVERRRRTAN